MSVAVGQLLLLNALGRSMWMSRSGLGALRRLLWDQSLRQFGPFFERESVVDQSLWVALSVYGWWLSFNP